MANPFSKLRPNSPNPTLCWRKISGEVDSVAWSAAVNWRRDSSDTVRTVGLQFQDVEGYAFDQFALAGSSSASLRRPRRQLENAEARRHVKAGAHGGLPDNVFSLGRRPLSAEEVDAESIAFRR